MFTFPEAILEETKQIDAKASYDDMIGNFIADGLLDFSGDQMVRKAILSSNSNESGYAINILNGLIKNAIDHCREQKSDKENNWDTDSLAHDFYTPLSVLKANAYIHKNIHRSPKKNLENIIEENTTVLDLINSRLIQYVDYQNLQGSGDSFFLPESFVNLPILLLRDTNIKYFNGNRRDTTLLELIGRFDLTELEQAMVGELVKNARFHSDPDVEAIKTPELIDVSIIESVDNTNKRFRTITVQDYGNGMKQEDIKKILLPSVKLAEDRTSYYLRNLWGQPGAGFGLTIIQHIMDHVLHGEMDITSGEDQGTIVTLKYPV